jgi:DNA-binding protein YbaB
VTVSQLDWIGSIRYPTAIIQQMQAKTQLEQEALAAKALEAKEVALANAAIARARGEAESIRIKGEALRANPQVLQQLAIEKWNGELPKVTGGSTPFVKIDSMRLRGRASGTSSTSPMRGRRAVGHHHDAVGQQHGLVDVMGDHHHGVAERAWISITASCRCARVSASSAPKGSSSSRIFGSMASARAMPTRCFMPPEISEGRLSLAWAICTRSRLA